jgi:hypothetical protein
MPSGAPSQAATTLEVPRVECPPIIIDKVRQFIEQEETYDSGDYSEAQVRIDFINPLLEALGWDVTNKEGRAEAYREVVYEDALKLAGGTSSKAPDYGFYIGGRAAGGGRKFFLEAKRPSVPIRVDHKPAFQLRRYAYSAELPLSILTNFKEFIVYDTRFKPSPQDSATAGAILTFRFTEYPQRWHEIASIFSRDAILRGAFDRFAQSKRKRGMVPLGESFLQDIESWREVLAKDIAANNDLSVDELNFAVQRTIDRILFLRICEDRGIEPTHNLLGVTNGENIYPRLGDIFRAADDRYNSGIFHFPTRLGRKPDPERAEPPDDLTLDLAIDDAPLRKIIRGLYDNANLYASYEFSVIPPEILGQVYEQFLGKVITLKSGHRVKIEEKPEVRKAGGVYYTPEYIVRYIVKNTVGKLLEGKTPADAAKITIVDPASGSGSFLIGAYQFLLDWHLRWYLGNDPDKHCEGKKPALMRIEAPSLDGEESERTTKHVGRKTGKHDYRLTTSKRKEVLLNSIFGVDIDPQAVEVTKLSLLLKVLEGESKESIAAQLKFFHQRALPDLGRNIKCGNSLIDTDFDDSELSEEQRRKINKFNWKKAFPAIVKARGFDAVIGNPPYLFITEVPRDQRSYYETTYQGIDYRFDLYGAFIERSLGLMRKQGVFGFIIPHTLLSNDSFKALRIVLSAKVRVYHVVDLGPGVFQGAKNETMLLFFSKGASDSRAVVDVARSTPKVFPTFLQRFSPKQQDWIGSDGSPWLVHVSDDLQALLKRMDSAKIRLGDLCTINQGCRTGDNDKYVAASPKNSKWKPAAGGRDIGRYTPIDIRCYVYYDPKVLDAPRRPGIFFGNEKLVVQEVRNIALSRRLVATLDREQIVGLQSTNVINRRSDCTQDLRYLLGVLNSNPANVYFRFRFPGNNHIPSNQLARIPIPEGTKVTHDRMVKLVDRILELHKKLATAKTPHDKERIPREIEATDQQIDSLVYELYGLTQDEIRIVEQATARTPTETESGDDQEALFSAV